MADSAHLPTSPTRGPAIIASAARVKLSDRSSIRAYIRRITDWQSACWDAYDGVGEVKYAVNYQADALSKLLLFVGERDPAEPDGEPIPTDDPKAIAALDRLRNPTTGHAELLKLVTANLVVAGEVFLHGHEDTDAGTEDWQVRSAGTVAAEGEDRVVLREDPDAASGGGTPIPATDMLARIWLPHPRFPRRPDSPLRGVLQPVEEIGLWSAASRATARSRLSAGLLLIPDSIDIVPFEVREGEPGTGASAFLIELLAAMMASIEDEDSAAAVVPIVLRGSPEAIEKVRRVELDRSLDAYVSERQSDALRRTGQGMNLPGEVITGMGSANHWSGWLISEETWKSHLEPLAVAVVSGLTTGYLTAALEADDHPDPSRFVVWFDPQRVIARVNVAENAKAAHEALVISDETLRDALGFSDDDAPDADEVAARSERARSRLTPGTDVPGPPSPEASRPAVTAAAGSVSTLGARLAALDRRLTDRLQGAADMAVARTLDRIGVKLRGKAGRGSADLLGGVANDRVAATLGPDTVGALGLDIGEVLEGAFDRLATVFDTSVATVQRQAAALIPASTGPEAEALTARQGEARTDAWAWLHTALDALTRERIYDPSPAAPADGEWDDGPVPHGLIREALARAGGAGGPEDRMLTAALTLAGLVRLPLSALKLGVAVGETVLGELARHGLRTEFWTWSWGGSARPFPPHQDLDGVIFDGPEDPVLLNTSGFPDVVYYQPLDHSGCRCDQVPTFG